LIDNINWYPGHMKKTREMIREHLKLVDLVIEVVDARIPISSRNPIIDEIIKSKTRVIVLNKSDLSDENSNREWMEHFKNQGHAVAAMNCLTGEGIQGLYQILEKIQSDRNNESLRKRYLRIMIVGVPNVGKSSLINRMTGKKSTQTGDRPGVTKGKQWLNLENHMQMLDTPGILWPKFEDPQAGLHLAFCGSIKDEIMDLETLALELLKVLCSRYPKLLMERYKLAELPETALETMEAIAAKRGFLLPGKKIDYTRCAKTVLDEFRAGIIGRITLESATD